MPEETPARQCDFTVLDFETTGVVKGYQSLPWQLGAVTVRAGVLDLGAPSFDTYLCVPEEYPFSKHAPGEHRANRAAIARAPAFETVWQALHSRLSVTVPVAHNVGTERNILLKFAPMTRYPYWVDTLKLTRTIYPGLTSYALEDLIPLLGLQEKLTALVPGRAPHDAYYDAVACALLLEHILALPGWDEVTLATLTMNSR